jgi:hypothetical protein
MSVPSISTSKAAAAVINAMISLVGLAVSIAPLPLGADGVADRGDQPPFAALVVGVILGVLGLVGSLGLWRGLRWGAFLTIGVRGLDGLSSLFGVTADDLTLRSLAILSVAAAVLVIYLILRRDQEPAES